MKMMKILGSSLAIAGLMTITAQAVPITGTISFTGDATATVASGTTTITPASPWTIIGGTIDYSGVSGSVSVFPIAYTGTGLGATLTSTVTPQWSFTILGTTYSFDLLNLISGSTTIGATTAVALSGTGVAHITGKDATFATWSLSGGGVGPGTLTFAFETTSAIGRAVPDGGTTVALLGAALSGLAWFNARRKK